jgi:uncharacterized protein YegJ (DUF2314 family)
MKNLKWKHLLYLSALAVMIYSCKGSVKNDESLVYMPTADSGLVQAKLDAQNSYNQFEKSYDSLRPDTNFQFSVKKDFVEGDKHEHMWILLTNIVGDSIVGKLNNHPEIVKNLRYFDRVTLHKNDMEDWMIYNFSTKTSEGGFSEKVIEKGVGK